MTKLVSLLLALFLAIALIACGSTPGAPTGEDSSSSPSNMQNDSSSEGSSISAIEEAEPNNPGATLGGFGKSATIAETVLVDEFGKMMRESSHFSPFRIFCRQP